MQMCFVGEKGGDYIQELSYTYVGDGQGEFEVAAPPPPEPRSNRTRCLGVSACLLTFSAAVYLNVVADRDQTSSRKQPQGELSQQASTGDAAGGSWGVGRSRPLATAAAAGNATEEAPTHTFMLAPPECHAWGGEAEPSWTPDERKLCCESVGVGCQDRDEPFVCNASAPKLWTEVEINWCCNFKGVGCPP